jgi:hypothetical protein
LAAKRETGATYGVELLYEQAPDLGAMEVSQAIQAQQPKSDVHLNEGSIHVFHKDSIVRFKDGSAPAQTMILRTDAMVDAGRLRPAIEQSWDWQDASATVARCRHQVLVTDLMSSGLDYKKRLEVFEQTLLAVVLATRPLAIYWQPAGKMIAPRAFIAAMGDPDVDQRVLIALNVRLFNIANSPGDLVMDTLGLGALLLPDLQLHFRKLDKRAVAKHLYNSAL